MLALIVATSVASPRAAPEEDDGYRDEVVPILGQEAIFLLSLGRRLASPPRLARKGRG